MRRLVAFLLLLAVGLALLLWIDRRAVEVEPLPEPVPVGPAPEVEAGETVELSDQQGQVTTVALSGPVTLVETDEASGNLRSRLKVRDARTVGEGTIDAEDIDLWLFEADGETVDRSFQARTGQLRLSTDGGELGIDADFPITLQIVEARIERGLPIAPLTLTVPVVQVLYDDRSLRSAEPVVLVGRGLSARGQGLFVDGKAELLRLEREPVVELELQDGSLATLEAAGPLSFADRSDLGTDLVEIRAEGGAHLVLAGVRPLDVRARLVRLYGRVQRDPDGFLPLRAEAEGDVVLRPADGTFRGDAARLDFDELARPRSATLSGAPRIDLLLREVELPAGAGLPSLPRSQQGALPVEGRGADQLELLFGQRVSFELAGPATLTLPTLGATLESRGPISGAREPGTSYATFSATESVRVRAGDQSLATESLVVEALPAPGGEVYARMTTLGATRIEGVLEEGARPFALDASEGLVYVRRGESFEVPRAEGVRLEVLGAEAFRARARTVRDLVGDTLAFVAEGDVEFENELGRGSGARLVAQGREQAELLGSPGVPARFTSAAGELVAARIEARPTRLFAQDDVQADVHLEGTETTLRARWLSVDAATGNVAGGGPDWTLDAGGEAWARSVNAEGVQELRAERVRLTADEEREGERLRLVPVGLEAIGAVDATYTAGLQVRAQGDRLTVDRARRTRLEPAAGARVHVEADLPAQGLHATLDARAIEYGAEQLEAEGVIIALDGLDLPSLAGAGTSGPGRLRAVAGRMLIDRASLLFSEGAIVGRLEDGLEPWSLEADKVLVVGSPEGAPAQAPARPGVGTLPAQGPLDEVYAWGGFVARTLDGLELSGDRLHVSRTRDRAFATGVPARVSARGLAWESGWFEVDGATRSIKSGQGAVRTTAADSDQDWVLHYESLEPVLLPDSTIQVLREPRIVSGSRELRASWALFWVDPRRWRGLTEGGDAPRPPAAPAERRARPRMQSLFVELDQLTDLDWLRELFLDGDIEYSIAGEILGRASSIYVDLVDGKSWVRKLDVRSQMPFTSRDMLVKVRAEWLRHSADGTYVAENAVATTCSFEEPHYVVRIGKLAIEPRREERIVRDPATGEDRVEERFGGWSVQARNNRLTLWRDLGIPLPRIGFPVDEELEVDTESVSVFGMRPLSFGNDAKFGTFVGTSFDVDFGWLARWFDKLVMPKGRLPGLDSGKADLDARWLDSRGALLGLTIPFWSPGAYWLDLMVDGLFDSGNDKGLVKVDKDERDDWRGWYRTRGRFFLGKGEWLDVVATYQSDPGVQAEFFEGDYQRFEERETYLHWRKAAGDTQASVTVEERIEDFRTEVVEQPSASWFDGRSKVASLGPLPLYYGGRTSAGYYKLEEGDPLYEPPPPLWAGSREVLRLDSTHRLEVPVDLSLAGLRATPYLEGRFTAWDEGLDADEQPNRLGLLGGLQLATTLFRGWGGGSLHALTPSVGLRTDIATSEDDVPLVPIDRAEEPLQGTYVDLGLRSLWTTAEDSSLDVGLQWTHGSDLADGAGEGWLPLSERSTWLSSFLGIPYVISHDGRFDLDSGQTDYSRALFGFRPVEPIDVELAHHFGRDPLTDAKLYDAATLGLRYRFSRKWELEGRQTVSNTGSGRLASGFLVRRMGHDFVFELETRFVAGEGESFGFKITPLLLYRSSGFGLLDSYQRRGY